MYGEIILQLIREFQRDFSRNLQHSVGMLQRGIRMLVSNSQIQVTRDVD